MRLADEDALLEGELVLERGVRQLARVGVVGERGDVAEEEEGGEGLEGRLVRSEKTRQGWQSQRGKARREGRRGDVRDEVYVIHAEGADDHGDYDCVEGDEHGVHWCCFILSQSET